MRRVFPIAIVATLVLLAGRCPAAPASDSDPDAPTVLAVAPYDVELADRAVRTQAWVVLHAASAFAARNGGNYPVDIEQFEDQLPRRQRMHNVWTGERDVPSAPGGSGIGSVEYRAIYWRGHPVGCQVVAIGRYGERTTLVSDLSWWQEAQARLQLSDAR